MNTRLFFALLHIPVWLLMGGCYFGDVPPAYRVDTGLSPRNIDKDVRFRTTYYFRVMDSCRIGAGVPKNKNDSYEKTPEGLKARWGGKLKVVNDTLYRFRMTGKAAPLFNTVHFESGVLRAEQIDPFGSAVVQDPSTGRLKIFSPRAEREGSKRDSITKEIDKLIELSKTIHDASYLDRKRKMHLLSEVGQLIDAQLHSLDTSGELLEGVDSRRNSGEKPEHNPSVGNAQEGDYHLCPNGRPTTKSFFLYGPEGVRRLDPDERLLMAMSSDSKPLISMLQQISGKRLEVEKTSDRTITENLMRDRTILFRCLGKLSKIKILLQSDLSAEQSIVEGDVKKIIEEISEVIRLSKESSSAILKEAYCL